MMMCFNALFKALFWGTEGGFAFRAPNYYNRFRRKPTVLTVG